MNYRPRKRFGQNFLQDSAIILQIIHSLHLKKDDKVLEIGPGRGALTQPLLAQLDKLTAIEIDRDLAGWLKENLPGKERLELLCQDALTVDYHAFGSHLRIVGNLPYNISTPLILHLLTYASTIEDMHFMLQTEVIDRIAAAPNSKDYGRLSVMVQYYCQTIPLFDVPKEAFYPIPKVSSTIIKLIPHKKSPFPPIAHALLEEVVGQAFKMRRKTLENNFKGILNQDDFIYLNLDPKVRPETLSVFDFVRLGLRVGSKRQP